MKKEVEILRQILRFAEPPSRLGFCGVRQPSVRALIDKQEWDSPDLQQARNFISELRGMNAYLQAIAEATGKKPLDREVVAAYLVGWDGWEAFDVLGPLKQQLKRISIPSQFEKIDRIPPGLPYTHNFHVLYFGAVAREIPNVEKLADHCKISLGCLISEHTVTYNQLRNGSLVQTPAKLKATLPGTEEGDWVFLHYGRPFKLATPAEAEVYHRNLSRILEALTCPGKVQ